MHFNWWWRLSDNTRAAVIGVLLTATLGVMVWGTREMILWFYLKALKKIDTAKMLYCKLKGPFTLVPSDEEILDVSHVWPLWIGKRAIAWRKKRDRYGL